MSLLAGRIARFGIVGASLTLLNYVIYWTGLRAGVHYLAAAALGWGAGVVASYFANKSFTFGRGRSFVWREFAALVVGYVLQLVLGLAGLALLVEMAGFGKIAAYWINLAAMAVFSFVYMQVAVFKNSAYGKRRHRIRRRVPGDPA